MNRRIESNCDKRDGALLQLTGEVSHILDLGKLLWVESISHREQVVGAGDGIADGLVDARLVFLAFRVDQELTYRLARLPYRITDFPALCQQVLAVIDVQRRFFLRMDQQVMAVDRREQYQQPQHKADEGITTSEAV